ncbi:carboxypeptidase regulatory-like domain-containing protein [Duganella sp. CT11-25]|uniref:carboxypeptidase regulatory-like domain-containing protein n=1 Tax=unclassified Duganella TaxID=2636909 RepID=UPI0039B03314
MQPIQRFIARARTYAKEHAHALLLGMAIAMTAPAMGQSVQPAVGASCTISALNRNAPVAPDNSFEIYNIPGDSGPFRARATCSDGTVGQTPVTFPEIGSTVVYTGDVVWGKLDPTPLALGLRAANQRLNSAQTAQLVATAVLDNAAVRDVTPRAEGTRYTVSNALLASVTQDGLVTVLPLFASGSSARVVTTATNEGGIAASYMFVLGPRGTLSGQVTRADGITPVAGAQVTVMRHQPMEQAGTALTDAGGRYALADVNAGSFTLSVIDPASGDRGQAAASIAGEGENGTANIKLNGQGQVQVTVVDAANQTVAGAGVTLTALGAVRDTRTLSTDVGGRVTFAAVAAGDFTVSTRDPVSRLVGTAVGVLPVGAVLPVTLQLQPVGTVAGTVLGADGAVAQEGVQVRILSRERGIVSQSVTGADGRFSFNPLPLSDGPFTLDAFVDGRLRARVPDLVLSTPNQVLSQDVRFSSVGTVRGIVSDANGKAFERATLALQMLDGLRQNFSIGAGADGVFLLQGIPVGNYRLTASTPDGRSGSVQGNMPADGAEVLSDVQLAASGLVGTVYLRDGVTPAGAGVAVYLQRRPTEQQLTLTLASGAPAVVGSALTNAQGQYSFAISNPDLYVVQAQQGDNRGRTQIAITALVAGKPDTANVAFLGKGSVGGVVRDGSGQPQAGLAVTVKSVGAFTNSWTTSTDASGRYALAGVYVGDIVVSAENSVSKLGGVSNGRMIAEGDSLALDVTLSATGTVRGRVLRADNSTAAAAPLLVQLYRDGSGSMVASQTVANGNQYEFGLVPLGRVRIVATETASGDQGLTNTILSSANEVRSADVRLIGQGAVRVRVVDAAGAPVSGATVGVTSLSAFGGTSTQVTDAAGVLLFQPVFNGDFSVAARKPAQIGQLAGDAQGTLVNGQTIELGITLSGRPTGKIGGIVFGPDGVTPRDKVALELSPAPAGNNKNYKTVTGADGRYLLENIEGGTGYTLSARMADPSVDQRLRARAAPLLIATQDQQLSKNLQLFGAGIVTGRVALADGTPAKGITVVFNNPDPTFGRNPNTDGSYSTVTDSDGNYTLADMPSGDFTLRAQNASQTLRAEANGRIRFDQDHVVLDLTLVDNSVGMPYTLRDASAMPFDIAGDGSVINGKNGIFTGLGPDARGMRLDIVTGGVPLPFRNGDGSIGRLSQQQQQIELDEDNASGLRVSRNIYVPKDGYFARYVEMLENRGTAPVTVDVRLTTHHSQSDSNPRVVDSSDGDDVLSVQDAVNRDRWLVVDDQRDADPFQSGSVPATGHLFDGQGGARQVAAAGYELVGQTGKLVLQWAAITLQPGQRTALMHFDFNQVDRYRAREAALRLAQLPPEALAGLSEDERAAISNFQLPADGVGTVPALPPVGAGRIAGSVLSGDGVTPVAGAAVRLRSKLPMFGRVYTVVSDAAGRYALAGKLDGSADAMALPLYGFDLDAVHPQTRAASSATVGDFPADGGAVAQDLTFNGTATLRGVVRRNGGTLMADSDVWVMLDAGQRYQVRSGADGSYALTGLPPRDYPVQASKDHPQMNVGSCCGIEGKTQVAAVAGATTVADITLEQVGAVSGIVRAANGDPVVGAQLRLSDSLQRAARLTVSDTAGRYRFSDVRLGLTRIDAYDDVSKAGASATVDVSADNEALLNLALKGFGTVDVQVNFARGAPAPGAPVLLGSEQLSTDTAGRASRSVQVGAYHVRAKHPDNTFESALWGEGDVTLDDNGGHAGITLTLKAAGAVKGSVVRPDGSTLAGGFPYTVRLLNGASNAARGGNTDAVGNFRIGGLPLGLYLVSAYDKVLNRYADAEVTVAADGDEAAVALRLEDNRIALPATQRDANRFDYDVQSDGGMASGYLSYAGAARLEIDGQPYSGDNSAVLELGKRQFAIAQETALSGLKVSRKVYVPKGGYFARYLEVLDNPGSAPVAVRVSLRSQYPSGKLVATSSGAATASTADRWLLLDDADGGDILLGGDQPSAAEVFGQAGAARNNDQLQLDDAGAGTSLMQGWQLTVPAGGKVALLHFMVQQVNRNGALAAAQRLVQLPPEALDGLTAEEAAAIVNFTVPADGVGTVASLPPLTAGVSGRVVEGDGVTAVNNARVTLQSSHPLFNRVWGLQRDQSPYCEMSGTPLAALVTRNTTNQDPNLVVTGAYSLQGQLTDNDSIALPVGVDLRLVVQESQGCFVDYSGHPVTRLQQQPVVLAAAPGMVQDLRFGSGILTGTVSGAAGLGITSGRVWRSIDDPDDPKYLWVPIGVDGTYVFPGLEPGNYDMLASVPHPQGSALRGERLQATVTLGKTTVTDLSLQATGAISGTVVTSNGEASVNARVELIGDAAGQQYDACAPCTTRYEANIGRRAVSRAVVTDTLGRYAFSAVPAGSFLALATDPISGGKQLVAIDVAQGQTAVQNVTLLALGSARLTLVKAGGAPAPDANVYLLAQADGAERLAGRTNAAGQLTVANIPQGDYRLRITDPRYPFNTRLERVVTGNIANNGDVQQLSATLLSVGSLRLTVLDGDNGNAPLTGVGVTVDRISFGQIGAEGSMLLPALSEGEVEIAVQKTLEASLATLSTRTTIGVIDDNAVRELPLALKRSVGSLNITVLNKDQANAPVPGAQVSLSSGAGSPLVLGNTDANGQLFRPGVPMGSYRITARASFNGVPQEAAVAGEITPQNIGQTQSATATFERSVLQQGLLSFDGERQLFSVPMNVADVLAISLKGVPRDPVPAAYLVSTAVYDRSTQVVAAGYAFGPAGNYAQTSTQGNLKSVKANATANYTISVAPYNSEARNLGGYELAATVNGTPVFLLPYQDGGAVSGTLFRADRRTPVAGAAVRLRTLDSLQMQVQTSTDADGKFLFPNVPLANYELRALNGTTVIGSATGVLSTAGATVVTDIVQPSVTLVNVQVRNTDGTPFQGAQVSYTNNSGASGNVTLDADARGQLVYTGDVPVTLTAIKSSNSLVSTSKVVAAADGQTVDLVLTLASAQIGGRVVTAAGAGVAYADVQVNRAADAAQYWRYLTRRQADSQGYFSFPELSANDELIFSARNPYAPGNPPGSVRVTAAPGQVITDLVLPMPTSITIRGKVMLSTGQPYASAFVSIQWQNLFDIGAGNQSAYTDQDGKFQLSGVPGGTPITLGASYENQYADGASARIDAALTTTVPAGVPVADLPPLVLQMGAMVRAGLRTADGSQLPWGDCDFTIKAGSIDGTRRSNCDGELVYAGLPAGPVQISIAPSGRAPYGTVTVNAVTDQEVAAQVTLSKIAGVVRYANGGPAAYPTVYLLDAAGELLMADGGDSDGNYAIYGARAGAFSISAQDSNGLASTVNGTLADTSQVMTLDLTLPPYGTVSGVVRNAQDAPVANAQVYLRAGAAEYERNAVTDDSGRYTIEMVPVGGFVVSASDNTGSRASVSGQLAAGGASVTADLRLPATGTVSGKVLGATGSTGIANADVQLRFIEADGAFGNFSAGTQSDASGAYQFGNVAPGLVSVQAFNSQQTLGGVATATVVSAGGVNADVRLGTASQLPLLMAGADNQDYGIDEAGMLSSMTHQQCCRYTTYYGLVVNGVPFTPGGVASAIEAGREYTLGPRVHGGLRVTRRIYVPAAGGYVRMIETLSNTTAAPIDAVVKIRGLPQAEEGGLMMKKLDAGSGYVIYTAPGYSGQLYGAVATVYQGTGGIAPSSLNFFGADASFDYGWKLPLAAGQTISLMHFSSSLPDSSAPSAKSRAQALGNGSDANMLHGLTPADKAAIQNFKLNP